MDHPQTLHREFTGVKGPEMVVKGLTCRYKGRATWSKSQVKGTTHRDELMLESDD